jgi:hypothetical protein
MAVKSRPGPQAGYSPGVLDDLEHGIYFGQDAR